MKFHHGIYPALAGITADTHNLNLLEMCRDIATFLGASPEIGPAIYEFEVTDSVTGIATDGEKAT